jgi:hypothetical protein
MTESEYWGRSAQAGQATPRVNTQPPPYPELAGQPDTPAMHVVTHPHGPGGESPATIRARADAQAAAEHPWWERFVSTEFLALIGCLALALADANAWLKVPEELYAAAISYIVGRSFVKGAAAYRSGVKS